MSVMLRGFALDWSSRRPRLVQYLGRVEEEMGPQAMIMRGHRRVVVPHADVFWLGAMCHGTKLCCLSPFVGTA